MEPEKEGEEQWEQANPEQWAMTNEEDEAQNTEKPAPAPPLGPIRGGWRHPVYVPQDTGKKVYREPRPYCGFPTPLTHPQALEKKPKRPREDPNHRMYRAPARAGRIPPVFPPIPPSCIVKPRGPPPAVYHPMGGMVAPIPQPKYPGGPAKLMAQGQECHLKLRPIWVIEKGEVPDLKAGAYEAVPEGFERILEQTGPKPTPKHKSGGGPS